MRFDCWLALCCGFAGDRGFTFPELNRYGLRKLRPQIEAEHIEVGYSNSRIIYRHILPNVISSAVVYAASDVVICMMSAASLSFLGLGVQAPTPEWGAIISSGKDFLGTAWWITVIPGLVLAFTGWGFSMIGDGLSDMLRARGK